MDRLNQESSALIELGSVTTDTKGPPQGEQDDGLFPIKRAVGCGLSDD